jgi:hypothetical protein
VDEDEGLIQSTVGDGGVQVLVPTVFRSELHVEQYHVLGRVFTERQGEQ